MRYVLKSEFNDYGYLYLASVKLWDAGYVRELSRAKVFDDYYDAIRFRHKYRTILADEGKKVKIESVTDKEYFQRALEGK